MTTAIVTLSFDEMGRLAEAIASSGLFGMKTPEQALALMAISAAEGIHPALAARDYHIIQGRPTLKADAMLARFQTAGGKMEMQEYTDTRVVAKFSHPQGGSVLVDWDVERAKRAGLGGKDTWKQYPRQMLRARVISEGVRTVFPGATAGFLVPEEVVDIPGAVERDVTPAKPATGVAALQERVAEIAKGEPPAAEVIESEASPLSVDEIVVGMGRAETKDDLDALVDAARRHPEESKKPIRKAYGDRLKVIVQRDREAYEAARG